MKCVILSLRVCYFNIHRLESGTINFFSCFFLREIFVRDKCIGNPSAHTTEKVDNKTAQKLKGLYLRVGG